MCACVCSQFTVLCKDKEGITHPTATTDYYTKIIHYKIWHHMNRETHDYILRVCRTNQYIRHMFNPHSKLVNSSYMLLKLVSSYCIC